jgi:glutamine synthetase
LINQRKEANLINDAEAKADSYCYKVKPYFDTIRYHCDKLELLIDDEIWPMPKYRELLFTK